MNVKDYLNRINYNGPLTPDLKTLTDLTRAHKNSVPFTSVEFMCKGGVDFELEKIYQNVVYEKSGGVCYQLNRLFAWLLEQLGFQVSILLGSFKVNEITDDWTEYGAHNFPCVSIS